MVLSSITKFAIVVVFSLLMLMATTAVSIAQSNSDSQVKADFVFSKQAASNSAEIIVQFNDESTGEPQSWNWDFGDGGTSTDNNPTHVYQDGVNNHIVTLTVSDASGNTDTASKNVDTSSQ